MQAMEAELEVQPEEAPERVRISQKRERGSEFFQVCVGPLKVCHISHGQFGEAASDVAGACKALVAQGWPREAVHDAKCKLRVFSTVAHRFC